ncbi:MAG: hypothetical protein JO336_03000, partial [Acidobacteriia bacterium]|nr:hypothetical protein [Terriglobia bacterium]
MGSVTNSLSSSLNTILNPINTAGSSTTNGQFTGASAYSQDFQNTISRAVAIADLPITLLQNQQTDLTNQNNELSTLDGLFSSLNGAVSGIDSALNGGSSYQASYSVSNVVNATFAQGAAQGSYSINVSNLGAYQSTLSGQTWNASPSSNQYTLVVGANEYTFTPADDSAQTVASTINSLYGNLVSASAVNVGSQSTPDYRVSLQSNTLGPMNLDLVQLPSSPTYTSLQGASAPANYSTSQSSATWNPSGAPFTLVVGGNPYSITTSNNTAQGVAAAINAQYGNLVQATVVTGSGGASDYRINLQSATPSAATLDIQSSGVSLQTQGAPVSYSTSQTSSIWSDTANPSGTRSLYQLVVGSNTYSLAPPDNTAADVAATINSQFGSTVQATVTGTPGQAGYGISLRSTTAGSNTTLNIQKTTATSYQSQQTAGALAQYSVDGAATVSSNSRAVTVSN